MEREEASEVGRRRDHAPGRQHRMHDAVLDWHSSPTRVRRRVCGAYCRSTLIERARRHAERIQHVVLQATREGVSANGRQGRTSEIDALIRVFKSLARAELEP